MANLRGQGSLAAKNLIIIMDPKHVEYPKDADGKQDRSKDPIARYLDVQIDQSLFKPDNIKSGKRTADTNPHLVSSTASFPDRETGETVERVTHRVRYSESQYQAMVEAANQGKPRPKVTEIDGMTVLGVNAPLTLNKGQAFVRTNAEMGPSDNMYFGKTILDKQAAVTEAAKEVRDANLEAAKSERTVEAEVKEAPAPEHEAEPEV